MRIVKNAVGLLLVLALIASSISASGFESFGVGLKARAMGNAFRGVADNWTAAYYNPGGYGFLMDSEIGGDLSVWQLRDEVVPNFVWGDDYSSGFFNDRTNYNDHEINNIPSGGFAARVPLFGETVIGLSAFQPFDNNVIWFIYDLPEAYNPTLNLPLDQFRNDLDVVAFQLTFAREITEDKMSFGLGLELLRGDLQFNNLLFHDNPLTAPYSDRPYDKVPRVSQNDGTGWGFGFRAGILYKINEKLNMGLSAHVPLEMTISGESKQIFYMPRQELPDQSTFPSGSIGNLFVTGEQVDYDAQFETDLTLPSSFGVGFAYQLTEKLNLAFDVEYTLWSSFEGFTFTYTEAKNLNRVADTSSLTIDGQTTPSRDYFVNDMEVKYDWSNTAKIMFGFGYDFNDAFTFLGGVQSDQSPFDGSEMFTPHFIDLGSKLAISGGIQLHINQWDIGIAQIYTNHDDLTVSELTTMDEAGVSYNVPGDYKADTYETVLSFNYRF